MLIKISAIIKNVQKHRSRQITSGLKIYPDFKMYLHVVFFEKFPLYNLPDRKKDYIVLTKI